MTGTIGLFSKFVIVYLYKRKKFKNEGLKEEYPMGQDLFS